MKRLFNTNRINDKPNEITIEAVLTPKRSTGTELIAVPRAEYEHMIRKDEAFNRLVMLLTSNSLSSYTVGEVARAMFPEYIPVTVKPEPDVKEGPAPDDEAETPREDEGADA